MYNGPVPGSRPEYNIQDEQLWAEEARGATDRPSDLPEVWFHHHGIRWLSSKVKKYIRERDIVDVGASTGDSLVVLSNYTEKRVLSYELIPASADNSRAVARRFPAGKHFVFNIGLSNVSSFFSVEEEHRGHSKFKWTEEDAVVVKITTIDAEAKRLNMKVGLIKADVEGVEIDVVLGALDTIQRDRPVIAMSIYHNEEFVYLPKLLGKLGYELRFLFPAFLHMHYEAIVIAIPPEVESLCITDPGGDTSG
jgi:FkbM family methyltransferase